MKNSSPLIFWYLLYVVKLLTTENMKISKVRCAIGSRKNVLRKGHLFLYKSSYLIQLNTFKWKLITKALGQIKPSGIRNKISYQMAPKIVKSLIIVPGPTKCLLLNNIKFTSSWQMLVFASMIYTSTYLKQNICLLSLWLAIIAISENRYVWNNRDMFTRNSHLDKLCFA